MIATSSTIRVVVRRLVPANTLKFWWCIFLTIHFTVSAADDNHAFAFTAQSSENSNISDTTTMMSSSMSSSAEIELATTVPSVAAADKKPITILNTVDDLKQISRKRCVRYYTFDCLKLDIISLLDRMGRETKVNLIYGIAIVSDSDKYLSATQRSFNGKSLNLFDLSSGSDSTAATTTTTTSKQLNELFLQKLKDYVQSLTLNVQLFDQAENVGSNIGKKLYGESLFDSIVGSFEGRASKKTSPVGGSKISGSLTSAALVTAGALLWLGLSTTTAIAAKALFTALASIVVSCFTAYKSSGSSGHKSTTYEIVARPVYGHGHHSAATAAEIQHDPHLAASSNGAATAPVGYGRNMEWDKSYSSYSQQQQTDLPTTFPLNGNSPSSSHDAVYRAHVRPIYKRATTASVIRS